MKSFLSEFAKIIVAGIAILMLLSLVAIVCAGLTKVISMMLFKFLKIMLLA